MKIGTKIDYNFPFFQFLISWVSPLAQGVTLGPYSIPFGLISILLIEINLIQCIVEPSVDRGQDYRSCRLAGCRWTV